MNGLLRVLCTSTGGAGHVHALAPIARALRDRGHDVRWAVGADGGEAVGAMGFEWTAAGLTTAARREAVGAAMGAIMRLPMDERRGPLFSAMFARAAAPVMRRDLAPIIGHVRPDVILRESGELAAAPMAAARGIPLVTTAFSGVLPERARDEVVDELRPLWQAEGLADPSWADVYGQLYLHPFPVSFGQRPDSPIVRPIRPDRGAPSATVAGWVAALGVDRPFVYVTVGNRATVGHLPVARAVRGVGRPCRGRRRHHRAARRPGRPRRCHRRTSASSASSRRPTCSGGPLWWSPTAGPARCSAPRRTGDRNWSCRCSLTSGRTASLSATPAAARSSGRPNAAWRPSRRRWAGCSPASHRDAATRVAGEIAAMPPASDLAADIEVLAARSPRD